MIHRRIGGFAAVLFLLFASCGESATAAGLAGAPVSGRRVPDDDHRRRRGRGHDPRGADDRDVRAVDDRDRVRARARRPPRRRLRARSTTTRCGEGHRGGRRRGDFGVDPTIEKVVSLEPDLFLTIPGGDQWKQRLRDLDIPVVTLHADTLDDLLVDIQTIGELTGAVEEADALATQMGDEPTDHGERGDDGHVSCFFEVYYPPLTTVGPNTFIFDLLERAGCDPVTEEAKSDYPEWSVDELVADGPEVYLVTPESAKSVAAVSKRPGSPRSPRSRTTGSCWSTAIW